LQFALKSENAGEAGQPRACAFSPDGTLILTATRALAPRLWDAQSGKMTASLAGHTGEVLSGGFSSDGTKVVTSGVDKTVRLWDAKAGRQLLVFEGHDGPVSSAYFLPDNSRVVSIASEGKALVWDTTTGAILASFGDYVPLVQDAVLSRDGARLLISNYQYSANLWDPNTGKLVKQLTTRSLGAAFSQDSSRLVTGSGDGRVTAWQSEDGEMVKELFHGGPVSSVLISPNGRLVVTADERPHVWNMPELGGGADTEIFSLYGHTAEAVAAGFSRDGKLLLTFGPKDRTARVWDITGGAQIRSFGELDSRISDFSFSTDGSKFLTSGSRIQIWNASTMQLLATTQGPPTFSFGEQFSVDGRRLIAHCFKGSVCVFDASSGALISKIDNIATLQAALSPDGTRIVLAGQDHSLVLYDVLSAKRLNAYPGGQHDPTSIVFSPDGRQILAAVDQIEHVLDVTTGQEARTLKGSGAIFSADGALVATQQRDTARLYSQGSGRLLQEMKIPAEAIETIAFSRDAAWLAAGSTGGVIKIWDVKTGRGLLSLTPKDGRVRSLRFSADGKNIFATTDGAIHCYDANNGSEWQTFRNNFGLVNAAVDPDSSMAVAADTLGRALLYSFRFQDLLETAQKRLPAVVSAQ
jgi:WD40 repeat protein